MYLKSLEMQGFKSFPDKTKLTFEQPIEVDVVNDGRAHGVTFIVGPNGSGKSNIVDAMRWVLGEVSNKTLRGTKLEDVIFSGADSRRPMGYAEVSVTFDNRGEFGKLDSEYDEITVTRRYFRAGDSEYFINRKSALLRNIYELFLNTGIGRDGYSIIGQGRIAEMVSRKSEERRGAFEDASGIAKYRHKKEEEERKMAEVEDNISRINDIYGEIESRLIPLEKASSKAKEAREAMEQKKIADVSLWLYDTEDVQRALNEATVNLERALFEQQQAADEITSIENQMTKMSDNKTAASRDAEQARQEISKKTTAVYEAQKAIGVAENGIHYANQFIDSYRQNYEQKNTEYLGAEKEMNTHLDNITTLTNEKEQLTKRETELNNEKTDLNNDMNVYEDSMSDALDKQDEIEKEQEQLNVRLGILKGQTAKGNDKKSGLLAEIAGYEQKRPSLLEAKNRTEKICADHKKELEDLAPAITEAAKKLDDLRALKKEKEGNMNQAIFARESIKQRIDTAKAIQENMEGYPYAIKTVMTLAKENRLSVVSGLPCGKVYGPLVSLIKIDEKYSEAIGAALDNNAQFVVVDNSATAKACIYALKNEQAGVTTIYPAETMKAQTVTKEMEQARSYEGYLGTADSFVGSDDKFRGVIGSLIGRTVVFDTFDHANKMAKDLDHRVRVVTLDGQRINAGGSVTGGGKGKENKNLVARQAEMQKLEEQYKTLCQTADTCKNAYDTISNDVDKAETDLNIKTAKRSFLSSAAVAEGDDATAAKYAYESNEGIISRLTEELNKDTDSTEEDQNSIVALEKNQKDLEERLQAVKDLYADFRGKKQTALNRTLDIDRELRQIEIDKGSKDANISAATTLKDSAEGRYNTAKADADSAKEKLEEQEKTLQGYQQTIDENTELVNSLNEDLKKWQAELSKNEDAGSEYEEKYNNLITKQRDAYAKKSNVDSNEMKWRNKVENLQTKSDDIAGSVWDEYGLTRADALALNYPAVTKDNYEEISELQKKMEKKLRVIGPVDLASIDEYLAVKERYDKLTAELTDLTKSKEEITEIVANLEADMKTTFVDAFNKINENFGKVFAELFGGGIAELSLEDPDDVLESGIEIKAAPPGKIIKNLMALSGGEQSLVGVALFFAILQVNPTPFCILDEIDAALDSVNVDHLATYLKKYSENTQFIVITHRQEMMSVADKLYGVSMPEHGISQIYQPDIDEIRKQRGKDWDTLLG